MSKRQSDTGQSQGTSPGRMNYRSHGKSPSFEATWLLPCKGRPTQWKEGGGIIDNGVPKGRTPGFSPNPALCFLSRTETPTPPNTAASPQCQPWLHTGLSKQIGHYHPEEAWSTHCSRSWTSPVRSPFGGSTY